MSQKDISILPSARRHGHRVGGSERCSGSAKYYSVRRRVTCPPQLSHASRRLYPPPVNGMLMTTRTGSERVGVIGLGTMGGSMAKHLLDSGYAVCGYDVRGDPVDALVAAGGEAAMSPAEMASAVSVVITSLPSVAAFETVIGGDAGLAERASPGLTVIETSTLPLPVKQRAHDLLGGHGAILLDCPLSGTGTQMRERDVAVYASGDADAIERHRDVLASFSRSQFNVGGFGNGSRVKFIANLLVTIHNAAAAEALLLARRAGLDLDTVFRAISDGAGTSRMLEVRGPLMIAGVYSEATMRVETHQKDIDIILAFARELRCPTPLFMASAQLYMAALAQGRGDQDTASVFAVLEGLLHQ